MVVQDEINKMIANNFHMTKVGLIIPITTGSISFVSSGIIVFLVMKSRQNNAYHRIMFLLSIASMVMSLAIVLSTLPMPRDVIYPFYGKSYGTTMTCTIQGFTFRASKDFIFALTIGLTLFYLCILRFKMAESTYRKKLEPVIYVCAFMSGVIPSLFYLKDRRFNPTPRSSHCGLDVYPLGCSNDGEEQCIRGDGFSGDSTLFFLLANYLGLGVIILSMSLIVLSFYKSERILKEQKQSRLEAENSAGRVRTRALTPNNVGNDSISMFLQANQTVRVESEYSLTRKITFEALMYVSVFTLSWIFSSVSLFTNRDRPRFNSDAIEISKTIFESLHGFFNFLIFAYHKVSDLRKSRRNMDLSIPEALFILFHQPDTINEIAVSMSMVIDRDAAQVVPTPYCEVDGDGGSHNACGGEASISSSVIERNRRLSLLTGTNAIDEDVLITAPEHICVSLSDIRDKSDSIGDKMLRRSQPSRLLTETNAINEDVLITAEIFCVSLSDIRDKSDSIRDKIPRRSQSSRSFLSSSSDFYLGPRSTIEEPISFNDKSHSTKDELSTKIDAAQESLPDSLPTYTV